MAIRYTFTVYERLKREQHIDTLFHTGKACSVFPIRLIWLLAPRATPEDSPAQAGFSVPKKKFKRSVQRHRVRRLMVEAWRLHKHLLYPSIPADKQLHLFLIFTDSRLPAGYEPVKVAMVKGIDLLAAAIANSGQAAPKE